MTTPTEARKPLAIVLFFLIALTACGRDAGLRRCIELLHAWDLHPQYVEGTSWIATSNFGRYRVEVYLYDELVYQGDDILSIYARNGYCEESE